jgi:Na+-translocating ferredoxin:NAD+ oxidoreductase RnfG subunit
MLVVGLSATYSKKIVGPSVFAFDDVPGMGAAIEKASATDDPQVFVARSVGRDVAGNVAAEFEITWSFKRRSRG